MVSAIIEFLVLLNPFALFLYLLPIMRELDHKTFAKVLMKASLISLIVYLIFLAMKDLIFTNILHIHFESFRIFGGIVIFSYAFLFIVQGNRAMITMKPDLDDLASNIALPFMIGAGTITLTILMGSMYTFVEGGLLLALILSLNYLIIMVLKFIRDHIQNKDYRIAFDKNMEVFLRLNGFFVGAIGVNMIMTGIINLFF